MISEKADGTKQAILSDSLYTLVDSYQYPSHSPFYRCPARFTHMTGVHLVTHSVSYRNIDPVCSNSNNEQRKLGFANKIVLKFIAIP